MFPMQPTHSYPAGQAAPRKVDYDLIYIYDSFIVIENGCCAREDAVRIQAPFNNCKPDYSYLEIHREDPQEK